MWASTFTSLEKASNLGDLLPYRLSEPPSGDDVMEGTEDAMSEVKLLNVSNANAVSDVFNLKPCVKVSWNTVLKGDVYVGRPVPLVSGDDRTLEATEELSILASQHAVWNVGKLGYPYHLGISSGVLRRVQNEVKCLTSADSPSDSDSFASDHCCLHM